MKKIFLGIFLVFLLGVLYLAFWPVSLEPVAFKAPANPGFEGDFSPNEKLDSSIALLSSQGIGPEDVAISPDSMIYTGFVNGDIYCTKPDGSNAVLFVNTKGRPLGMEFDSLGNLIVADADLGLISINKEAKISILANEVEGSPIFYADDLDIASDGMIYFSDATTRNRDVKVEIMELQPTGRLIQYNPSTKTSKIIKDGMRFANGVAVGPNDDYLLVTETFGMQLNKLWLKGVKTGTSEVFMDQFPGFLDNISYNDKGIFWLAMPDQRIAELEAIFEHPALRKVLARLPKSFINGAEPKPYGMVVGINTEGEIVHNLQSPSGKIHSITSATEFDGHLYLGSLKMKSLRKYNL